MNSMMESLGLIARYGATNNADLVLAEARSALASHQKSLAELLAKLPDAPITRALLDEGEALRSAIQAAELRLRWCPGCDAVVDVARGGEPNTKAGGLFGGDLDERWCLRCLGKIEDQAGSKMPRGVERIVV